jgi:hypothetical protein
MREIGDCSGQPVSSSSGWMFTARPCGGSWHFWGSGFGRLLTTHRESARWSISVHDGIASRQAGSMRASAGVLPSCRDRAEADLSRLIRTRTRLNRVSPRPALPVDQRDSPRTGRLLSARRPNLVYGTDRPTTSADQRQISSHDFRSKGGTDRQEPIGRQALLGGARKTAGNMSAVKKCLGVVVREASIEDTRITGGK